MYRVIPLFLVTSTLAVEIPTIEIKSSKLSENSIDTTQTVEVFNIEKIDSYQIKDIKDFSATISNANISGLGSRTNRTFTFRGISNYVAYESSIAMYVDDAPVPFSFGYGTIDMNNIHSLEVLKGPQGTEFGKGAESGVINLYTMPTTKTFQSEVSADFGTNNLKDFCGRISGPIKNSDFSYALSVSKKSNDGFSDNLLTNKRIDDREVSSFSAKIRYNPNSPWEVALNYSKNRTDDGGSSFKVDTKENPYKIDDKPYDESSKMDNDLLSFIIKYKEKNYTFTSATSYAKQDVVKNSYANALNGLQIDLDVDIEELTQEARLNYIFENIDLLAGAFYSNKLNFDYKEKMYSYAYKTSSTNSLENPDENIALFTQMKYWIDPYFAITAGIRYQETKRSFDRNLNQFFQPTTNAKASKKWNHILPTLSLSYFASDDSHTYIKYSKGYRPGGYNYRAPGKNLVPFEPEETKSFEIGHKQSFSSSLSLNGALFYNDIKDHRTVIFSNNLATTTLNAKRAYSYGAELDLNYKTEKLSLYATFGVIEAKFKDFDKIEYEKNTLLDVPDMTAALGTTYNFNKNFSIQSSANYIGKRYYDIENILKESGYITSNISLRYSNFYGWRIMVYATNLFNQENVDFAIHTPDKNYYHFTDPRVVGLKISKSF